MVYIFTKIRRGNLLMSQVCQTGRWQQCHLIVHIQRRKGSSPGALEHPPIPGLKHLATEYQREGLFLYWFSSGQPCLIGRLHTSGFQVPPGKTSPSPGQNCPGLSPVYCLKTKPTWTMSRKWFCILPEIAQQRLGGHLVLIAGDLANPLSTF